MRIFSPGFTAAAIAARIPHVLPFTRYQLRSAPYTAAAEFIDSFKISSA